MLRDGSELSQANYLVIDDDGGGGGAYKLVMRWGMGGGITSTKSTE